MRYIKDLVVGNCSIFPLSNGSMDSLEAHETYYGNGTEKSGYSLHMKNPLQFLKLDSNYDYVGQVRLGIFEILRTSSCEKLSWLPNYNR